MPYAPAGDIQLYYEVHGPKSGATGTIVFAHGAGGSHLSWWQQVPHFRKRHTCVVFDHRGFGLSPEPESGPGGGAFADDLRALLDHLGIARCALVAQSMGGWTSVAFARAHPGRVERIVMCDTVGGLRTPTIDAAMAGTPALIAQLPPGVHPAAGVRMFEEQPELHFLYLEIAALSPERTPQQLWAMLSAAGAPTVNDVRALTMPVLLLAGDEDIVIPPAVLEETAGYFPDARFVRVPRAGHSVYFERAAEFNELVERFLEA